MASDPARSLFSGMEPADLSYSRLCPIGVGVLHSMFGHFPRGNNAQLFPGQADSRVLSRRTRSPATGDTLDPGP